MGALTNSTEYRFGVKKNSDVHGKLRRWPGLGPI